jgi:hypothetical protein
LVEGISVNATVRMAGVSKGTILKLIADLGMPAVPRQGAGAVGLCCRMLM